MPELEDAFVADATPKGLEESFTPDTLESAFKPDSHPVRDFFKRIMGPQSAPLPPVSAGEAMLRQAEGEQAITAGEVPTGEIDVPLLKVPRWERPTVVEPTAMAEALRGPYNKIAEMAESATTLRGAATAAGMAVAPEFVVPAVSAPGIIPGAQETVEGVRERDIAKTTGGLFQTVASIAGVELPMAPAVRRVAGAVAGEVMARGGPAKELPSVELSAINALDPRLQHERVLPESTDTFQTIVRGPDPRLRELQLEGVKPQDALDLLAGRKTVKEVVEANLEMVRPSRVVGPEQGHAEAWIEGYQLATDRLNQILESQPAREAGAPVAEAAPPEGAKVPLMVTREMEQSLADLGYPERVRRQFTPEKAQQIINEGTTYAISQQSAAALHGDVLRHGEGGAEARAVPEDAGGRAAEVRQDVDQGAARAQGEEVAQLRVRREEVINELKEYEPTMTAEQAELEGHPELEGQQPFSNEPRANQLREELYDLNGRIADLERTKARPVAAGERAQPGLTSEEIIGMGGAVPGEFKPGGSAAEDIFGIAQRVREEMAATGRFPYTSPGVGTNAWEMIQRGRRLLREGADPAEILQRFEQTQRLSSDDVAVLRAHMEELDRQARRVEEKYGTQSPEWLSAQQKMLDFYTRTKAMATEAHKIFVAHQGATDVDTGDLASMARAQQEATGRGFSKQQAAEGERVTAKVRGERTGAQKAQEAVHDAIDKTIEQAAQAQYSPKVLEMAERFASYMDKRAEAALGRIREKLRNVGAGVDPTIVADLADYGAAKITRGVVDFAKWSDAMVRELGEAVRPFLKDAFAKAQATLDNELGGFAKAMTKTEQAGMKRVMAEKAAKGPRTLKESQADFAGAAGQPSPKGWKGTLNPQQTRVLWNRAKNEYIAKGEGDIDAIASGLAEDFGLPREVVMRAIAGQKGVKTLTNEMYLRQARARQAEAAARAWLVDQRYPGWLNFVRKLPGAMFTAVTFGHGTVGMVTHVGMMVFDPLLWGTYFKNFGKQFALMTRAGYHEAQMQTLMRSDNFVTAKRAGLANDPFRFYEDYSNPMIQLGLGAWARAGKRGFDILKLMRQDMFDRAWGKLSPEARTPEAAEFIATNANHATGVVTGNVFGKAEGFMNTMAFAPRLELSRWAFLFKDTAEHLATVANWRNATPEARMAAVSDLMRKTRMLATYVSALTLNQALLKKFGSDQEVNYTEPWKGDFLSFKMFGHDVGVIHPVTRLLGYLYDMLRIASGNRSKFEELQEPAEQMAARTEKYLRGKASPFGGTAIDVATSKDFMGRPMPWSEQRPSKSARRQGLEAWGWGEYAVNKLAPIPVEEAIRETFYASDMDRPFADRLIEGLKAGAITGLTGVRYTEDKDVETVKQQ